MQLDLTEINDLRLDSDLKAVSSSGNAVLLQWLPAPLRSYYFIHSCWTEGRLGGKISDLTVSKLEVTLFETFFLLLYGRQIKVI